MDRAFCSNIRLVKFSRIALFSLPLHVNKNTYMTQKGGEYSASSIQALEGLEAVRKDQECILEVQIPKVCITLFGK